MLVTLARVPHQGWIKEVEGDSVERRRAYHLTAEGRRVLRTELRRLEAIVVEARSGRLLAGPEGLANGRLARRAAFGLAGNPHVRFERGIRNPGSQEHRA